MSKPFSLSWSAVQAYRLCPAYAYFERVERVETKKPHRVAIGNIVATMAEEDARSRLRGQGGLDRDKLRDAVDDEVRDLIETVDFGGTDPAKDRANFAPRAFAFADYYIQALAPVLPVIDVERRITIRWRRANVAITGYADLWLAYGIGDLKTTSREPSKDGTPSHRAQVSLYGLAWRAVFGRPPSGRVDYLVMSERAGGRSVRHLPVVLDDWQMRIEAVYATETVLHVAEQTQRGNFPRDVSRCGDVYGRRCPHEERCKPWRASRGEGELIGPGMAKLQKALPHDRGLTEALARSEDVEIREMTSRMTPRTQMFELADEAPVSAEKEVGDG